VTHQFKAQAITVKTGTLVDATIISAATYWDKETAWAGHERRKAAQGFKAHVAADADTALVKEGIVTPGNLNDRHASSEVGSDEPGAIYAHSAYRGTAFASAAQSKGGCPRVVQIGV
jgi:IS5 family transposase